MTVAGVITQIRTTNLKDSIDFYTTRVGLELEFEFGDFYAGIRAGDQLFHLKLVDDPDPTIDFVNANDHFHLFFPVDDIDEMASRLHSQGVTFSKEISTTDWGARDFYVRDNQGHTLCFSQFS
jgi:catechol 2,3-dioxygenase-like lactoylglutathione lyase family enzyme